MAKTVAILQSNYLPWRGYFDLMRRCDLFILGDTVQYTKRDWRNRNIIKTPSGSLWLTIPVWHTPRATTAIDEVQVSDPGWASKHIDILRYNYRRAAAYEEASPWLFELLQSVAEETLLTRVNTRLLCGIALRLGITTDIVHSSQIIPRQKLDELNRNSRAVELCRAVGATCYLSGPAAKDYLDEPLFQDHGIDVAWMSYEGYPDYPQLWGSFEPKVSIVDLLLNMGQSASAYLLPVPDTGAQAAECGQVPRRNDRETVSASVPEK